MQDLRKQLDELMGVNRNGDKPKAIVGHFEDDRVCKFDLCGLCPYQLFPNTKQDLGPCPHELCPVPDKFKEDYKRARLVKDYGYESQLLLFLERKEEACDDQVIKKKKQLLQRGAVNNNVEPEELIKLRVQLDEMTNRMEELGMEGQVNEALGMIEKIESLQKEKQAYEIRVPKEQQLIICDICSGTLSANETDQRLSDHFAGKAHIGFQKIRDKIKMILAQYPDIKKPHAVQTRDNIGPPPTDTSLGPDQPTDRRDSRYHDENRDARGDSRRGGYRRDDHRNDTRRPHDWRDSDYEKRRDRY